MKCPDQAISQEAWIDYVEGTSEPSQRERIERHVASCHRCRKRCDQLVNSREALVRAASVDSMDNGSGARLWNSVLFRVRRFTSENEPAPPVVDFSQLRSILVSMCGEAAAEGALHTAAVRSGSNLDQQFARNLGSIIEVMCGSRAARLVEHAAQSLQEDRVA